MIKAYIRQQPRIEARESLQMVAVISIGNGVMPRDGQRRYFREWNKLIKPGAGDAAAKRQQADIKNTQTMSRMGIKVIWHNKN